jgi:hypothetical protein
VGLGNPNLRVEVPDVGGGVLVALRRVLAEEIGAHARRDARRHAWLPAAAREWKRSRWWWGFIPDSGRLSFSFLLVLVAGGAWQATGPNWVSTATCNSVQ